MCEINRTIENYFGEDENRKKEVCERMGMVYSTFARKTNLNDNLQFNILELIPYTLNTDYSLLDHIERRCGRIAVEIPKQKAGLTHRNISKLAKEAGEAIAACASAIEDNVVDEEERKDCIKELLDLTQVANSLLMHLTK